jgi:hypothetical protein
MSIRFCIGAVLLGSALQAAELRDPMQPPQAAVHGQPLRAAGPLLSAVLISGTRRGAIINGEFVRSGGSVGGCTVIAVLDDGVRCQHAGRVLELHLPKSSPTFKKPATVPARTASGVSP